jgi:pyruvate-formate lyase
MYKQNRREFMKHLSQGAAITLLIPTALSPGLVSCKKNTDALNSISMDTNELVKMMADFTKAYQENNSDIYTREAACMNVQWRGIVQDIQPGDLFAGRSTQAPIGFRPQSNEGFLGYYIHHNAIKNLYSANDISAENKKILDGLVEFWDTENTVAKTKKAFTPEMNEALPSDNYGAESGIAFTLWRMSGVQFDYGKLIRLGISGLKDEIKNYQKEVEADSQKYLFYAAALSSLDTFSEVSYFYAKQAAELSSHLSRNEKKEMAEMAKTLTKIATEKPQTFREGLQLMYLYNALDGARNYGRMDDYMGDLYVSDIENKTIDEEEAVRLLSGIWKLMAARNYRYDTRLIIGGKGRINEPNADKLALAIMETSKRVQDIVPQVALRFYNGQNPALYEKGLEVLATGHPFPMLYNDEVNVPSVQAAFDVPYEDAVHAIQYGCGEYVLNHRSVGTPSGLINLLQALIVTVNKGIDPKTGEPMGMPAERYAKYNDFKTFDDLFAAYKEQIEYHVVQLAKHEELEYIFAGKDNPYLYSSILMDDCIAAGKGMFEGGVRYLGGTLESYGNSNCADGLTAIKELVYDKKVLSIDQIRQMINTNFEGFEKERKMLLGCPKYGNDNDTADQMLVDIHNHLCNFTREQRENTSLHSYLVVIINNDANTVMGLQTPASPDGRLAYTHMNPGNNPVGGADKNGVTAFLNSIVKPATNIHAGAVQNMKFSKELFAENLQALEALLATYFMNGGAQAMLTVVSRGDLEDAMVHPEKYQNLIVRVGGFSERFVNLPPETQREVLSRTLY